MKKGRTIYLVLDGFHYGLLKYCPFIQRFTNENPSSVLESTFPPITSAAWATILTGKDPEEHGIWSFVEVDNNGQMRVLENSDIHHRYFNEYLDQAGIKFFLMGVPYNYPPRTKGGGYVFSWLCKIPQEEMVWPAKLRNEFPKLRWSPKRHKFEWEIAERTELFKSYKENFSKRKEAFLEVLVHSDYDFMMFFIYCTDLLQHRQLPTLDDKSKESEEAIEVLRTVDDFVQELAGKMDYENEDLVLFSDHGFKVFKGSFSINGWLLKQGYLKLGGKRFFSFYGGKGKDMLFSDKNKESPLLLGKKSHFVYNFFQKLGKRAPSGIKVAIRRLLNIRNVGYNIDLDNSLAYSFVAAENNIFINSRKFSSEQGYENIRREIVQKLNKIEGIRAFTREDFFGQQVRNSKKIADVILTSEKYVFSNDIYHDYIKKVDIGYHSDKGFIALKGFRYKSKGKFSITPFLRDIFPNILYSFNIPIPQSLKGRIFKELIEDKYLEQYPPRYDNFEDEAERVREIILTVDI